MKKTVIISALALCFTLGTVNAKNSTESLTNYSVESVVKVSPFCVSIAKGDIETVIKLISLGTNVNQKSNGMTPAMYAAKYNRTEILKLLISNGAKLKTRSDKGKTAQDFAKMSNAKESLALIKEFLSKK